MLVYLICGLSGGYFFLGSSKITCFYEDITVGRKSHGKSGKGQVPGRDGRGRKKGNFSSMIDDELPGTRHCSLCGTNTERSQTCEGECEHLSFTPVDQHKAINTHHSAREHAHTFLLVRNWKKVKKELQKNRIPINVWHGLMNV